MNSLHRPLTIIFLILFIMFFCWQVNLIAAQEMTKGPVLPSTVSEQLTPEEQTWLKGHPEIVLGTSTAYEPMVIRRNNGTYVGVLVDFFQLVSDHLNSTIRLQIEDSWTEIQKKGEKREIDGLAIGARDPSREVLYLPTDTILPTYFSVFGQSSSENQITNFSDLGGMRIGYKKGARPTKSLLEKLPSAVLKSYGSHESMTHALLRREIDVIVAWMSYDHWRKDKMQGTIDNLMIIEEYPVEMVSHIRKDWPELVSILNKTINALQGEGLPRLINKWFGQRPQPSSTVSVSLTLEERSWLNKKNTVRVRILDTPPYEIIKAKEEPQGIVPEYLSLIQERTGISFEYDVTEQPFAEFLESMKRGEGPDMTALIVSTPERKNYLAFTDSYLSSPYVIFTRLGDDPVFDIQDLFKKKLAVPRGFVVQEKIAQEYPEIELSLYESDENALRAVATGQADAFIGNLAIASHIIHKAGFSDLKIAAPAPFEAQALSMGVRKDWGELSSIINKALKSITEEEKTAIRTKYLAINFEQGIHQAAVLKWVFIAGGTSLTIVLVILFWNRQLSREISRRKKTEQELTKVMEKAKAANRAKSSFLANMSHELRTPLNAILGFSNMMEREQEATADQKEKLAIINRSGEHLLSMINDVLDLSSIETGRTELHESSFNLVDLAKEMTVMIKSRAEKKGLSLTLDSEEVSFPYITSDTGKLRQILINLLGNAVNYTDEGSIIVRVATKRVQGKTSLCEVVIEVEDTGPGIASIRQAKIFEPFVKGRKASDHAGTGLGLSICKRCADIMAGSIEVESEQGKGSLFRVRIPAGTAEEAYFHQSSETSRVIGIASEGNYRVLVVDDNVENLQLLRSLLEEVGFIVTEAENGRVAMDEFKKESYDLIWMDMRMPDMDGYEATRRIRGLPGGDKVKIIAITASAFKEQRGDIMAAGCDDVVTKPFNIRDIFEMMGRFLDIKYTYEVENEAVLSQGPATELTCSMLSGLPSELLKDLDAACLMLDREAISGVIDRVEVFSPETAKGLHTLLGNFQIGRIRELLDQT